MTTRLAFASVCSLVLVGLAVGRSPAGAVDRVQLTKKGNELEVTIGGRPFTVYHFNSEQRKPYFWPVRSSAGLILTRPLERPSDHPHHKGVWFSVDEVNGIKFWAESGKIQNVSVEPLISEGNPARFKIVNHWLGKDGQPILIESTTVSIFGNRTIAYDAQLTAADGPVVFEDTKEGLFGFRMVDSMHEPMSRRGRTAGNGKVENAQGLHGTSQCWGKTSEWVDYFGTVEGQTVGVAIFDNPHNFRRSRYHVRNYGLFSISPFGEHAYTNGKSPPAPFTLKPGANLRLRYALYIHDGDTRTGDVAGAYRKYVEAAGD